MPGNLDGRMPEAYTREREPVRRRVARTERPGDDRVQGHGGEGIVHGAMDAQGGVWSGRRVRRCGRSKETIRLHVPGPLHP